MSGYRTIFPDLYTIDISSGMIEYFKQYSGVVVGYYTRDLNTQTDVCSIKNTQFIFSGITTQFQVQNNTITITTPANTFTGAIELRQCISGTGCDYI